MRQAPPPRTAGARDSSVRPGLRSPDLDGEARISHQPACIYFFKTPLEIRTNFFTDEVTLSEYKN